MIRYLKRHPMASKILLMGASVWFFLVSAEIFLRIAINTELIGPESPISSFIHQVNNHMNSQLQDMGLGPDKRRNDTEATLYRRSANPDIGWELAPKARAGHIRINSQGFRGAECGPHPPPGVKRVVVLGDSQAFGMHLKEEETFANQLEKALNDAKHQREYEVINMGVCGYNTDQEYAVFKNKALNYNPSIIVIYYCFNDAEILTRSGVMGKSILARSYLYLLIVQSYRSLTSIMHLKYLSQNIDDYYIRLYQSPYFGLTAGIMKKIGDLAQRKGIQFYLVIPPELDGYKALFQYPYESIHAKLRQLSDSRVNVIDTLARFKERFRYPDELWVSQGDTHLNAKANRALAEIVAATIANDN